MEFYERFLTHINKLQEKNISVIFCGDINTAHKSIDLSHPETNMETTGFLPMEREWIDRVIKSGFIDTFRYVHGDEKDRYSWWSMRAHAREKNTGWRLDYFFVSDNLKDNIIDADILEHIYGSDHAPVILQIELNI